DIRAHAVEQYRRLMASLQSRVQALPTGQWLSGEHLGPVDAYALTVARWATMAGIAPTEMAPLWAYVQRVAADPAVARAIERERLNLNMHKPAA
ncbi:MAG: glutathione S-transferase family protein, partial [Betaproteobacteria bacterium]|nr:glutathione S-transferase family protein [Betaproteobacteria bacterium]